MKPTFKGPEPDAQVFVISVAAELSGLHPQTLRTYDRLGIVQPGRTGGGGRRYSLRDIELLRQVARLTAEGLGLEGVRRVIELETQVDALQRKVAELKAELDAAHQALGSVRNLPARMSDAQMMIWRRPPRR
ncbi:MAG TPA: MerR family transcriptional regulator [Aeromicrobium sp.]|nr:MerR family transcriptional regulator [Aeromicrobium sp.]